MSSEVCLKISPNSSCGFRLTGGVKFGMPLTVFEVLEGSLADDAGIRLGDVLVKINGMDANNISLDEAQKMINDAGENVTLSISNVEYSEDEEDLVDPEKLKALIAEYSDAPEDTDTEPSHDFLKSEASEVSASIGRATPSADELSVDERSASADQLSESVDQVSESEEKVASSVDNLATSDEDNSEAREMSATPEALENAVKVEFEEEEFVDVRSLPLKPPMPAPEPEKPVRKCWHPVMLDTSPPPIIEESTGDEEYPHKKTMRELRKAIQARKVKATPEHTKSGIEKTTNEEEQDISIDSERNAAVARQLRTMQKQLEKLSALPATIQATLKAVSTRIDHLLPVAAKGKGEEPLEEFEIESIDGTEEDYEESESSQYILEEEEEDICESFDVITEEDEDISSSEMENLSRPASQSDSEQSRTQTSELSSEQQLEKIAKMQKLETLNKSWPWADEAKPIYKIADHYEPVYARCISNKVKWLEEKVEKERIFAKKLKGI